MSWMNQYGITVYLQWPDELLAKHLAKIRASRPLLSSLTDTEARQKISELLETRKPVYEKAAITVELKGDLESDFAILEKACRYIW
mgnify:FL=1